MGFNRPSLGDRSLQKISRVSFVLLKKNMILAMLKRVQHRMRSAFPVSFAAPKPITPRAY
jgi:hypothetical protein